MERRAWVRWRRGYRPLGSSSWLLRRCRARRRCGRASPRAARRARLRPQADRAQPPRRARPGGQGRRLRRRARRGTGGGRRRAVRPRLLADGPYRRAPPSAFPDRRHLSAGHEGAPRGTPVRRSGSDDHPDRARRSRGGRGDERAGARSDDPGAVGRGGAAGRGPRPIAAVLPDADHAVGGRDEPDRRRPSRAVPGDPGSASRGHLLRNAEPSGRGEGGRTARRRRPGDRIEELLELEPARGGELGAGDAGLPGRRCVRGGSLLARRRRGRGAHLRSLGSGMAGDRHDRVARCEGVRSGGAGADHRGAGAVRAAPRGPVYDRSPRSTTVSPRSTTRN